MFVAFAVTTEHWQKGAAVHALRRFEAGDVEQGGGDVYQLYQGFGRYAAGQSARPRE